MELNMSDAENGKEIVHYTSEASNDCLHAVQLIHTLSNNSPT